MTTRFTPGDTVKIIDSGMFYRGHHAKVIETNQPYDLLIEVTDVRGNPKQFWLNPYSVELAK